MEIETKETEKIIEENETVPTSNDLIDSARKAAAELKAENEKMSENIKKQEELIARKELGGFTEAGHIEEKPKPLSDKEFSDKVMSGELNPLEEDGFI